MIKINKASWSKEKKKLHKDLGRDLEREMKDTFSKLESYAYTCSDKVCSIKFDETANVVGSEEWAVAASDTGGDWTWSKEPPFEKIRDWIIKHKNVNPKDPRLSAMTRNYQKKILDEGIHSHYWMDRFLQDYVNNHKPKSQLGSGII